MNRRDASMTSNVEDDIRAADVRNHLHPVTNPKLLDRAGPTIVSDGEGVHVRIDGKSYIDGFSGLGCVNVGYRLRCRAVAAVSNHVKNLCFPTILQRAACLVCIRPAGQRGCP